MIRNLKALGIALVAVFATGALSASSALAVDTFISATGKPVLVTGISHNHKLTFTNSGANIQCTTKRVAGTFVSGSEEMTIDVEYSGTVNVVPHTQHCSASFGQATVHMNGCHYVLEGATTGHDPVGSTDATVWITCPPGKVIDITTSVGITITIPPQTPTTGGVTYTNLPNHSGGAAIQVKTTITGMTYLCHGFGCHLAGIPTHGDDMDTTGSVNLTGYEDIDGLPTPVVHGPRVPISVITH